MPVLHLLRRLDHQLLDRQGARAHRPRLLRHDHQQRHDHRAAPVGHLVQVEREPGGQHHDLHRHHRHGTPRHLLEQRQQDAGEDVGAGGAARCQDGGAGSGHVRRGRVVARRLQREIGLHAGADVERPVMPQRPAVMPVRLDAADVIGELRLLLPVDHAEEVLQQDVFGRDGGVGLQDEGPVAVLALQVEQPTDAAADRVVEAGAGGAGEVVGLEGGAGDGHGDGSDG